ncbi:hypothetical protein PT974_12413 [Cladobotryum mycophilum]|uniref:Stress-response A/B barrel domain-containing protein n=1 Tax=Cladobotryum mycophilum TaxID=491253 RepID=A0ABR0S7X4_9HYPO
MAVHRVLLFKTKEGTTEEQKRAFITEARSLLDVIPGLLSLKIGPALEMSRTKGFDMGIILELQSLQHLQIFATHPAHLRLHDIRENISNDSLAFMLEH